MMDMHLKAILVVYGWYIDGTEQTLIIKKKNNELLNRKFSF